MNEKGFVTGVTEEQLAVCQSIRFLAGEVFTDGTCMFLDVNLWGWVEKSGINFVDTAFLSCLL